MNPNPYIDEDLQALAETARRFAEERVKPGFLERDKTREFDRALLRSLILLAAGVAWWLAGMPFGWLVV